MTDLPLNCSVGTFVSCEIDHVNALDSSRVGRQQSFERQQIVAFDDQVAVQAGLFALGQERELGVELQAVMGHGVVVGLDDRLALELKRWHLVPP